MPVEQPQSPKFEALYTHALETDMAALRGLTPEETFVVLLGALSALSLSEARLARELRVLLDQGCPISLAEDTLIQMAVYIGCPPARQALGCLAKAVQGKGMAEPPASLPAPEERYGEGVSVYAQLNPDALSNIKGAFGDLAGDEAAQAGAQGGGEGDGGVGLRAGKGGGEGCVNVILQSSFSSILALGH